MDVENSSVLKAVPEHEWPKVRDTYKKDWPYGIYPYYTMENFIRWRKKGFDNKFSVYCLDGKYDDGTTIMVSILVTIPIYPSYLLSGSSLILC